MIGSTSIILDSRLMFQSLQELESDTDSIIIAIEGMAVALWEVSSLTYAFGFGALMKKAETDLNQAAQAVVAANNAVNSTCSMIVNMLVDKFAPEGAKSSYNVKPIDEIHFPVRKADRAEIHPKEMEKLFEDVASKLIFFDQHVIRLQTTYELTRRFWSGTSAELTRHKFKSKVSPLFDKLHADVLAIYNHGLEWIGKSVKFEVSLGVE
jgi:hypothetical protein